MKMSQAQRVERAHVSLIRDSEYMWLAGIIVMGENKVVNDPSITARTDGVNAEYGEQFIAGLTDAELMGLVLHEKMHCAFKHLSTWRGLYNDDPELANVACDYVINLPIHDRYKKDKFVKLPDGGCVDEKYRGMDAGEVFRSLKQDGQSGKRPKGFDQHDWNGADQMTATEVDELSKTIDQALRQGNILASKAGANVDRDILEMLKPKVDWRTALREFVTNCKPGDDYSSYRRVDRRMMSQDMMTPTSYTDSLFRIVLAVDTSGSIGNRELAAFLSEVQGICQTVCPEFVELLYWGHNVAAHETYQSNSIDSISQSTKPVGGGGTAPSCVTAYLRDERIVPDCIVVLTDGDVFGDWGGEWPAPTLWCMNNDYNVAPTGVTVHM
jgi:predicted metal-dependent peptidase